ncbi:hypothetical protein CEY16_13065 [Halalkalibacillus sediminis]|uniref:Uncharacterized protein n=1 Tax=Halalkalibacillus sediminis TaxID=2018042 RepID=A0A2I0QQY4_9BACI|nr:hypothetical protein [Halalkalibacillus sediminis]PKR76744.1 hypothetical protein CEY16_13065 [Halalkalibacillus sediminis]
MPEFEDYMNEEPADLFIKDIGFSEGEEKPPLRIQLQRGHIGDEAGRTILESKEVVKSSPYVMDDSIIQVDFYWYISYSVVEESYSPFDEYEKYSGGMFRIYSQSRFIDYIKKGTLAHHLHPTENIKHYQIPTLNHLIDVVAVENPVVSEIKVSDLNI